MKKSEELRQKKVKLLADARAILEASATEVLSTEDEVRYDAIWADVTKLGVQITREEQVEVEEARVTVPDPAAPAPTLPEPRNEPAPEDPAISPERRARRAPEYVAAFRNWLKGSSDTRALQMDVDSSGGYLVAPEQFVARLIKFVDDQVFIRQKATTYAVPNAASLGVPSLEADPDDFDWTTELGTGSEDSTMAFGKREFRPHPLAKRIKVSKKLLRASTMDPEGIVIARLGYKVGVTQEKAFLTGNGNQRPLGVFVASNDGIPTGRDITASSTTAFLADDLQNVKYGLKPQYRANASWMFHRDALKMAAKLKDGNGQYMLQPGISADIPDRVLGLPFMESEFAPSTFTTGLYVALLGDFSFYWIADALDMTIQRLVELYAEANQDGFIARLETDGSPVLGEAFSRLKLA